MPAALDGFGVLGAVGANRDVFADARAQVQKAALAIAAAQLKCKTLDLAKAGEVRKALGATAFALVLEHMPARSLAAITRRIDQHCSAPGSTASTWHRNHIDALAAGTIAPQPRAARPRATSTRPTSMRAGGLRVTEENFYPASMSEAVGSRKE